MLAAEALIAKPRIAGLTDFGNGLLYPLDSFGLMPPSVPRRADSSHRHDARQHLIEVGIVILQRRKLCNGQHWVQDCIHSIFIVYVCYTKQVLAGTLPSDIRDQVIRFSRYAEALREVGVLLAVFGPVSVAEIFRVISLRAALVIWVTSAVILLMGVEWNVRLEREKRKLAARGLI